MILPSMICLCCLHYRGEIEEENGRVKHQCVAFPDEIPDRILYARADHRQPYPNDNGIRFEMNPAKEKFYSDVEKDFQFAAAIVKNREEALRQLYRKRGENSEDGTV